MSFAPSGNGQALAMDANQGHKPMTANGRPRKKRRSRKGLEKRFECKVEGCGKSYSRAEHLQRHQLNHNSEQTYHCEFPDCTRTFVRQDLLKRHLERHNIKDTQNDSASPRDVATETNATPSDVPATETSTDDGKQNVGPRGRTNQSFKQNGVPNVKNQHMLSYGRNAPFGQGNVFPPHVQQQLQETHEVAQMANHMNTSPPSFPMQNVYGQSQHNSPQFDMNAGHGRHQFHQAPHFQHPASTGAEFTGSTGTQSNELLMMDQMSMTGAGPLFGVDGSLPMVGMPADFMAYLFHSGSDMNQMVPPPALNYGDLQESPYDTQNFDMPPTFTQVPTGPYNVMAVNNLVDADTPEASISEERSQEIYDYINDRFNGHAHVPLQEMREDIVGGDRNDDSHVLSRKMMQAYIWSYWHSLSDQMPIIHKASFSAENTPTLLLLAMMAIGSACLDKTHGTAVTMAGARVSNFLSTHLRWELFMDPSFRAPAKLWVFQTLLVLELYEKMCSTRQLHERAHIHHATTITLMRRGRSLIGKSSLDESTNIHESDPSSRHSSTSAPAIGRDEWWQNWIINESTKRAACAAFVIDSIHSSMFGHSGVMVAHEMRLPLPCDDSLWRATSGAEVVRVEASLKAQGIKPMSFLEGLKCTLNNQEVNTTSFGRTVLMAGLLSVTHHMHQRDLQINVLGGGVVQALDGRDKWRATLTRAYDFWKANFDKAVDQSNSLPDPYRNGSTKAPPNVIFESRTVLHDLAHMAMHADIVDCQMFAGAKKLLGRPVGPLEFNAVQKRIKEYWAPSARARDAAFYALQFLRSVLAPELSTRRDHTGPIQEQPYDTRHDVLLNRPWVLYFAALVLWCYGFAIEGPCPRAVPPPTQQEQWLEMRAYLGNYAMSDRPEGLRTLRGLNQNTSLLLVLKESFENSRWELLHEAAALLQNCVNLNSGASLH